MYERDRQTDRHTQTDTAWRLRPHLMPASRGKNQALCLERVFNVGLTLCVPVPFLGLVFVFFTQRSTSLTYRQAYHKTSSTKQLVNGEIGYVQTWGKRTSLWTSAKLKPALFRANALHNRLFLEPPTAYWGKYVVSRQLQLFTSSSAVTKRLHDASCLSVVSFNALFCCLWRNVEASCHKHFFVSPAINTAAYYQR